MCKSLRKIPQYITIQEAKRFIDWLEKLTIDLENAQDAE
jgi:inhibitor of KinA sporulation pathway (predicted exonuclease)